MEPNDLPSKDHETIETLKSEPHGITFLGALKELASGNPEYVDQPTYLTRLRICSECPHKIKRLNVCGLCKCVLPLKARFKHAKCPENKW